MKGYVFFLFFAFFIISLSLTAYYSFAHKRTEYIERLPLPELKKVDTFTFSDFSEKIYKIRMSAEIFKTIDDVGVFIGKFYIYESKLVLEPLTLDLYYKISEAVKSVSRIYKEYKISKYDKLGIGEFVLVSTDYIVLLLPTIYILKFEKLEEDVRKFIILKYPVFSVENYSPVLFPIKVLESLKAQKAVILDFELTKYAQVKNLLEVMKEYGVRIKNEEEYIMNVNISH